MDTALNTTFKHVCEGLRRYIQHKQRALLSNYEDPEIERSGWCEVEGL